MASFISENDRQKINESLHLKLALQKLNLERNTTFCYYKPMQSECIQQVEKKDVIAALKTGYGKSLIFESLCYYKIVEPIVTLIISPLNAIIKEQVERYGDRSIQVTPDFVKTLQTHRCSSHDATEFCRFRRFRAANYSYVISHPEHIMNKGVFDIFLKNEWQDKVRFIVIDEAHCIDKWGKEFRKEFGNLSRLRSIFPHSKVLALTGTATKNTINQIKSSLRMTDVVILKTTVVRSNIKIEMQRKDKSNSSIEDVYNKIMMKTIRQLKEHMTDFPRTIVYSQLKYCALGYSLAVRESVHETSDGQRLVAQYHAPCTDEMKQEVQLGMRDNTLRLLFATEAYSMGTDSPNIRNIIHFGVPYTLETYLQEIGRAGRDGQQAFATMFFSNNDIACNRPCEDVMRQFCLTNECRWKFISTHFGENHNSDIFGNHNCCDNCGLSCKCSECDGLHEQLTEPLVQQKLDKTVVATLQEMLKSYFEAENAVVNIPNAAVTTGLDLTLLKILCNEYNRFMCEEDVKVAFPSLDNLYVKNIIMIIEHVRSLNAKN